MLSSAISGSDGDRLGAGVVEAVAGMDFEAEALAQAWRPRGCAAIRPRPRALSPSSSAWHQAPVWISITGAPSAAAVSICAGSAAMNSDTRMPAARSAAILGLSSARPPTASRPPSVVRSARRSGTRQAACGRVRTAIATISGGRRHFEIERLGDLRLQPRDVVVADVAAILAQMRGDAVGAGLDRQLGGAHRIGMPPAARVADGGDVVDVDAEAQMRNRRHVVVLSDCSRRSAGLSR